MHTVRVFFDNKRGVKVTERLFSTLLRDRELSSIVAWHIGREPLYIGGAVGAGLIAFALEFGGLLQAYQQMGLIFLGALLIAGGYSVASLNVETLFNEKTAWWHDYWTVRKVRNAIRDAKEVDGVGHKRPVRVTRSFKIASS